MRGPDEGRGAHPGWPAGAADGAPEGECLDGERWAWESRFARQSRPRALYRRPARPVNFRARRENDPNTAPDRGDEVLAAGGRRLCVLLSLRLNQAGATFRWPLKPALNGCFQGYGHGAAGTHPALLRLLWKDA